MPLRVFPLEKAGEAFQLVDEIVIRGQALGVTTYQRPESDRYQHSEAYLLLRIPRCWEACGRGNRLKASMV